VADDERLVFFDLETAGIETWRPIIQIAAVSVDEELRALESFEAKVLFDMADANERSLSKNHYSDELWAAKAKPARQVAEEFAEFLRRHATFDAFSSEGRRYEMAQLVAHNGERFDGPFLHAWYRRQKVFCPARYQVLCTKQRALWLFDEDKTMTPPSDFKLGTLCEYFGVPLSADEAHEAMADVRAMIGLYRAMRKFPAGQASETELVAA